jgi:hypothetical protein
MTIASIGFFKNKVASTLLTFIGRNTFLNANNSISAMVDKVLSLREKVPAFAPAFAFSA